MTISLRPILPLCLSACLLAWPQPVIAEVLMSSSGLCHCAGGRYAHRLAEPKRFASLSACIKAGGREPKVGQGDCTASDPGPRQRSSARPQQAYQRSHFGSWVDMDGDCLDTRNELLVTMSTGQVTKTPNGCSIRRGKWFDPYTDLVLTNAADVDIDHLVPLAYAWRHGADSWTEQQRRRFANDPANLIPVAARTNRQKGAKGPLDWMPEATGFHCQYLLRFTRVVKTYRLDLPVQEADGIENLRYDACNSVAGS